jgi:hypothetical protein
MISFEDKVYQRHHTLRLVHALNDVFLSYNSNGSEIARWMGPQERGMESGQADS